MLTITIENLRDYTWDTLWNKVKNSDNLRDDEKLIKAFLYLLWWNDKDESYRLLEDVKNKQTAYYYWVKIIIDLETGNHSRVAEDMKICQSLNISREMFNWLLIEYFGIANLLEDQADLFKTIASEDDKYPFIAINRFIGHEHFDCKHILSRYNLDHISPDANIEKLIFKIKLLSYLKKYDDVEGFIFQILSNNKDPRVYSNIALFLSLNNIKRDVYDDTLPLLDLYARLNFMDFDTILYWLMTSLSQKTSIEEMTNRVNIAFDMAPRILDYQAIIATLGMIYYWINNEFNNTTIILEKFKSFKLIKLKERKSFFVFFNFLHNLSAFRLENPLLYSPFECKNRLYVLGESHSLPLANISIDIENKNYISEVLFLPGVKMFHLNETSSNEFKNHFLNYLNRIETGSSIMLTIGEIDCRPDSGIWITSKNKDQDIESLIQDTVKKYINFINCSLKNKNLELIIIQGIPFPKYSLESIDQKEQSAFINMIERVNKLLKDETLKNDWYFLDLFSATFENKELFIDQHHLKPSFYKEIDKYLINK